MFTRYSTKTYGKKQKLPLVAILSHTPYHHTCVRAMMSALCRRAFDGLPCWAPPLLAGAAHEASAPVAILSHAPPPSVGGYFFPPLFTQASFAETPPQRARGGLCFRPWVYLLPSVWPPPVFAGRARYCVPYKFKAPPSAARKIFSALWGIASLRHFP